MYGNIGKLGDSISGRYSTSRADRVAEPSTYASLLAPVLPERIDSLFSLGAVCLVLALPKGGGVPAALVFAVESIVRDGLGLSVIPLEDLPRAIIKGRLLVLDADSGSSTWFARTYNWHFFPPLCGSPWRHSYTSQGESVTLSTKAHGAHPL